MRGAWTAERMTRIPAAWNTSRKASAQVALVFGTHNAQVLRD
jgi:hypothetical protein